MRRKLLPVAYGARSGQIIEGKTLRASDGRESVRLPHNKPRAAVCFLFNGKNLASSPLPAACAGPMNGQSGGERLQNMLELTTASSVANFVHRPHHSTRVFTICLHPDTCLRLTSEVLPGYNRT